MRKRILIGVMGAAGLILFGVTKTPGVQAIRMDCQPAAHGVEVLPQVLAVSRESFQRVTQPLAADMQWACVTPDAYGNPWIHCYDPTAIWAAYGVDQLHAEGITGKGQTIIIVDAYGSPTALEDLKVFSETFGLPEPDLTIIYPNGKPVFDPAADAPGSWHRRAVGPRLLVWVHNQYGWAFETSLDLQWAHALAPDAKLVLVATNPSETVGVQGFPSIFLGVQQAIERYPGSVISQSLAAAEQTFQQAASEQVARFDKVYEQAVANRVTVVSASGDWGTANFDKRYGIYPFPTVVWPSSDSLVTSVGGTQLQYGWRWNPQLSVSEFDACAASTDDWTDCLNKYFASSGSGRTEAVWREDFYVIATGGGHSFLFATPGFQSGLPTETLQGRRGLPDLSWNAAINGGVLVYTSFWAGGWAEWDIVGGTSASTPQIAGLVALTNQLRQKLGKQPIGYLNPALYQLPDSDFFDIVPETFGTGTATTVLDNNELVYLGVPGMPTTSGWDLTTGRGSPRAYPFVHDLAELIP